LSARGSFARSCRAGTRRGCHARPSRARLLARSLAGIGGFLLLNDIGGAAAALGLLWGIASLVGIVRTRGHRGLGGLWTGTVLRDRRCAATG
jgi:hypothetical protein